MKNKIILNIVLVYFAVISIVLVVQLYHVNNAAKKTPVTETVQLADRLNNAVVLCGGSPVLLVDQHQTLISDKESNITPIVKDGSFYVPLSFFETAYGAVCEQDISKKQASIRLDNTAVVFDDNSVTARLISNSAEKDIQLEHRMFIQNAHAYIPVDAFCEVYSKETFVYNDNMLIISPEEENVVFDPSEESELLQDIELQVNNLPLVLSENNLRRLIGVKTDIFGFNAGKENSGEIEKEKTPLLLNTMKSDKIAVLGDYIYIITGNEISVADSSGDAVSTYAKIAMPQGFTPAELLIYDTYLYVLGVGENAVMPAAEMRFDEEDGKSEAVEKTISGKKLYLLCYSLKNRAEPVMKRWFCTEGELVQKAVYDNTLCIAVKQNAAELTKDDTYMAPSYHDLNKNVDVRFDEIKYLPDMKDACYTSVFRFDLADTSKEADADTFLGIGSDIILGQNYVQFPDENSITPDNGKAKVKQTDIYRLNLNNNVLSKGSIPAEYMDMSRVNDGCAVLAKKDGANVLYTLNANLETDGALELNDSDLTSLDCDSDRAYMTNDIKSKLAAAAFVQVNDESGEDTQTRLQAQEKALMPLDGVEYIYPYESSMIGIGNDPAENNAEISMWSFKETAEKTAGDSVGAAGSGISPIRAKNFVVSELALNIRLFVSENETPVEKYNG
ncbi:MAG: beta-propeller domain-containing protein, partial [Firmicutes bacterium]|nr:beta-propeller domain-containing protein [Bacillota bacterium]